VTQGGSLGISFLGKNALAVLLNQIYVKNQFMETFISWMAVIGAICIGIMVLAVFFSILSAIKGRFTPAQYIKLKGFLNDAPTVDVHLTSGKLIQNVRFVGFTDPNSLKGNVPYQLHHMIVFETEDKRRLMLRGDLIKIIEGREKNA